jgi:exodeoxyribonuclease V gamma subunit
MPTAPQLQSPDFRLYHSNALEVLAGLLAEETARLPADGDWLRPDVVLVPQHSMRRWLQQALAERLGICANLCFLTPGEFVDLALDANLGKAPPEDRLGPEVLRWHLLRALQASPPAALAGFLHAGEVDADPLKPWSLAGALAETFEKYQAWRRDWLLAWERRAPADDWQAALWRQVARGRQHRARRIDAYLQRFGTPGEAPHGLPPRLFVFACQNVSPDVLQVISSQSRAGTQHFYLHTPARAFWGDIGRWSSDYTPSDDDRFLGGDENDGANPLLAAWGQAGRDFIATLGSGEAVAAAFEATPFADPTATTLLGRLQADVLDNRPPLHGNADPAWPRPQVDRFDASLQFHACHTRLREVQVLHDQLRALLDAPPPVGEAPLQPRDIAVLAPDIDLYAPHVEAVFGGAAGSARELPYTLADTSPLASASLAEAFLRLLELPLRAPTLGDVLDLLAVPAIAARFSLDEPQRVLLQDWLQDAGARWGLDAADRAPHAAAAEDGAGAYTFEFALDRLLLGYASGADDDIAGIAPWPALEGQSADTLDSALRFLALLRDSRTRLAIAQTPTRWQAALNALLGDAFSVDRDSPDAAVLKRLRELIAGFADSAATAHYDAPLEHAVVLEHLRGELAQADARAPFLSGGICIGRMVPMRLIPFRVVCLLGLDEASFPGRDRRDPINRIVRALDTRERRSGDPSRRDADRYLFLQLFTSAGRVLYLSWCGMDPRDNSRREPSAVVNELLDCAARYHQGDADTVREALVVRHALQPFAPAAFGAAHEGERLPGDAEEPRRFSYDARWRAAAGRPTGAGGAQVFAPASLQIPQRDHDDAGNASLDRLRRALLRPHAAYLQDGLGLRLPEDEPPLPEHEPLGAPDALEQYALRHAIFDAWLRAGMRPDALALHARLLARALVAPGADGRATVLAALDGIAPFATLALDAGFGADGERRPIAIACGDRILRGALDNVHRAGVLRVVLNNSGLHGNHVVRHGLDWLCASAGGMALHELVVPGKDEPPQLTAREPLDAGHATAILASLLGLRDAALRAPLPFLPRSGWKYVQGLAEKTPDAALRAARDCWAGSEWQSDRAEVTPATLVALRGRDPFLDDDVHEQGRFALLSTALFDALAGRAPLDLEVLR